MKHGINLLLYEKLLFLYKYNSLSTMGKGDKKSKKGKLAMGSHGNSRPRNANVSAASPATEKVKSAAPKAKAESAPKAEKKVAAKKTTKKAE